VIRWERLTATALILTTLLATQSRQLPSFGEWKRSSEKPILAPRGCGWESAGTFNPAVIQRDGRTVMIYRAQDAVGISRLGYAESVDGIQFARRSELPHVRPRQSSWRPLVDAVPWCNHSTSELSGQLSCNL